MRYSPSAPSPSFVDPSTLSLPSPSSDTSSPQSSAIDPSLVPTDSISNPGPSRKRARTDTTPEEKREARAHRNRIAAQNSRDRRKQQFLQLEEKVRALRQENDQLRTQLQQERGRRDSAEKDRENAELKERVKSLEQGWEAVLKALQTQGLPSSLFSNPAKDTSPSSSSNPSGNNSASSQQPTTFPRSSVVDVSTQPRRAHSPPSTGGDRHSHSGVPAAGGPAQHSSPSALDIDLEMLLSTHASASAQDIIEIRKDEDDRIEDWFRDVLASHDSAASSEAFTGATAASSCRSSLGPHQKHEASAAADVIPFEFTPGSVGEQQDGGELDRLLDLLPATGDQFENILDSLVDDGKASGVTADESWGWALAQPTLV